MRRRTAIVATVVAAGALLGNRLLRPPPPRDLATLGYTSARFEFRELPGRPALHATTSDRGVLLALAGVLASGRGDTDCRCGALADVTLSRPDGGRFAFQL